MKSCILVFVIICGLVSMIVYVQSLCLAMIGMYEVMCDALWFVKAVLVVCAMS